MLTCKELTEIITDYIEGRLTLFQRISFQLHLGMCRHCRAYLRQMRLTVRTLGKMPTMSVPQDVEQELLKRFRDWKR
ncbi:MAG: zf-HC2 domain-containing protein [Acidobacteriota bacterium]